MDAEKNHTGYPEEEDIPTCLENVGIYFSGSNHYTSTGIVVRTTKINSNTSSLSFLFYLFIYLFNFLPQTPESSRNFQYPDALICCMNVQVDFGCVYIHVMRQNLLGEFSYFQLSTNNDDTRLSYTGDNLLRGPWGR
jgi:hypothetical protein